MSEQVKPIALLSSSESWGGLEMNLLRIAETLRGHQHRVQLYLIEHSAIWLKAKELQFELRAIEGHRKYYDFGKARNLARLLKAEQVETLIFRDNFDMSLLVSTKYLLGNKIKLIYFQGMQLGMPKRGLLHTLRFRALDAWLTPLPSLALQASQLTRIKADKVHVVPLGRDFAIHKNEESRKLYRHNLDIPENAFLAGILGRLDPAKGQDLLIKATALVQNENLHLVFQGETTKGEHRGFEQVLRESAQQFKIQDRVHFAEFDQNPAAFFSAIDLFVMASKRETFGMSTIEALAAGVPVLGSDAGGTPEILEEGKSGVLFKTLNEHDLAQKLIMLLSDEKLRIEKAKSGLSRSMDFTTEAMYSKLKPHL